MMANYCILCGEEIPEYRAACGTCTAILESLPPERAKNLTKVIENEEARANLRAGIQEVKLQLRNALAPAVDAICDLVALVCKATDGDDQKKIPRPSKSLRPTNKANYTANKPPRRARSSCRIIKR